ncbi:MAG: formylglycine-generating enzyme family protein [Okeania sp. SIO3B3]|nr:formylglycine-generating enzyme family protein [Okeania sp. SIO3B3]
MAHQKFTLAWQQWRDIIEGYPFRDAIRDVHHFTHKAQQEAWHKLAHIENQPDVDAYLRTLALPGMIYIPAGPFLMGSADDDSEAQKNEKPQHEIWLAGYYIDRTPVTNAEYRQFVDAGGYERSWLPVSRVTRHSRPSHWTNAHFNGDEQPVVGVNLYETIAYTSWVKKTLPSEAQWEKAAAWDPITRQKRRYPWGNDWDATRCNNSEHQFGHSTPVGQYSPQGDSAYGLVDCAGNVREWTKDISFFSYPYQVDRDVLEVDDARDIDGLPCATRGGSWADSAEHIRCSARRGARARARDAMTGFRCVKWRFRAKDLRK